MNTKSLSQPAWQQCCCRTLTALGATSRSACNHKYMLDSYIRKDSNTAADGKVIACHSTAVTMVSLLLSQLIGAPQPGWA
jgi:hypothetical protein